MPPSSPPPSSGQLLLKGGFYQARSLIANAQRCVNLYPEKNPEDSEVPFTHYLTPGLTLLASPPAGVFRGLWTSTNGSLYGVVGQSLYLISSSWSFTLLGTLTAAVSTPVSMCDNGLVLVLVDGSSSGYAINLTSPNFPVNSFAQITDGNFLGADRVDYLDTYFLFNQPNTKNFYSSLSNVTYDQLTSSTGSAAGGTLTSGGGNYLNGSLTNIALLGGTGSGAAATLTVAGTIVTALTITNGGLTDYTIGDVLTANFITASLSGTTTAGDTPQLIFTSSAIAGSPVTITVTVAALDTLSTVATNFATAVNSNSALSAVGITAAAQGTTVVVYQPLALSPQMVLTKNNGATETITINSGSGLSYTITSVSGNAFDPLYIAAKTGFPDNLATLIVMHREIWLLGTQRTSEVWYDAGQTNFPFAIVPGVFIEQACTAKYSVAKHDLMVFWLSVDAEGQATVFKGSAYAAKRISTPAIAAIFSTYGTISDAIGMTYKQQDHVFYVLTFPSANATWVFDASEDLWHERTWTDSDGGENRIRANCMAFAYGVNVQGDWQTGKLYKTDLTSYTDNGTPIVRRRSFPHIVGPQGNLTSYPLFRADLEAGTWAPDATLTLYLRWSDNRGFSFGNPVAQVMKGGVLLAQPQWRNTGTARDRVFELYWSDALETALNGAWTTPIPAGN